MKITGLKTFVANVSRTNFVFVKLYTDEDIDDVGEATLEWKTLAVVAALEELERQLVGRDRGGAGHAHPGRHGLEHALSRRRSGCRSRQGGGGGAVGAPRLVP